jgi:hypothetical protein
MDISAAVTKFRQKRRAMEALANDLAKEDKNGAARIKTQIKSFYDALRHLGREVSLNGCAAYLLEEKAEDRQRKKACQGKELIPPFNSFRKSTE